jgi:hypothetical protein
LTALALFIASMAWHLGTAGAADAASAAAQVWRQERADCEAGRTPQDQATCLKQAGAAAQGPDSVSSGGVIRETATTMIGPAAEPASAYAPPAAASAAC